METPKAPTGDRRKRREPHGGGHDFLDREGAIAAYQAPKSHRGKQTLWSMLLSLFRGTIWIDHGKGRGASKIDVAAPMRFADEEGYAKPQPPEQGWFSPTVEVAEEDVPGHLRVEVDDDSTAYDPYRGH